jgi:hypothetical protein
MIFDVSVWTLQHCRKRGTFLYWMPNSKQRIYNVTCHSESGVPPGKELPTTNYATDLADHLHDIHNYGHQHLKVASDWLKTQYDKLANFAGNRVWIYRPTHMKGKSPKLQSSWEGPYKVVTRPYG